MDILCEHQGNLQRYLKKQQQQHRELSPVQTDETLLANKSQYCWMLHVASVCTPCCMLLDVVACCCAKFETSQTPNNSQHFFCSVIAEA